MAGAPFKCFTLRAVVVASAWVALLYGGATSAELPRLSVAHRFAQSHPVHRALEQFRENLAGVVSVEVNAPRNERESVKGMLSGSTDATIISPAVLQPTISELAIARAGEQEREATALTSLKERFGVSLHSFTGQDALVARTRPFRFRYAEELSISRLFTLIEKTAKP